MCWNSEISLNTFLFGAASLAFIIYNNTFTKYKVDWFDNFWLYIFAALVVSMQLIEFFLWRNLTNPYWNRVFSIIGLCFLLLQPIVSTFAVSFVGFRYGLLAVYLIVTAIWFFTRNIDFSTKLQKNGHLSWKFQGDIISYWIFWTVIVFACLLVERRWALLAFGIVGIVLSIYNYQKYNTSGSVWCWSANSGFLFLLGYVLIYLPFKEHRKIC